jgi:hypothetical protein
LGPAKVDSDVYDNATCREIGRFMEPKDFAIRDPPYYLVRAKMQVKNHEYTLKYTSLVKPIEKTTGLLYVTNTSFYDTNNILRYWA